MADVVTVDTDSSREITTLRQAGYCLGPELLAVENSVWGHKRIKTSGTPGRGLSYNPADATRFSMPATPLPADGTSNI